MSLPKPNFARHLLLALLLSTLIHAITYSILEGGTQFITYNGTLSGSFTPSGKTAGNCSSVAFYWENLLNTTLRIGANPEWDTNPFFFELEHDGNDYQIERKRRADGLRAREYCFGLGGCTNDAIYNLQLASTWYLCFKDGERCGQFESSPWYYVTTKILDLGAAEIKNTTGVVGGGGEVPMYMVQGDEETWVSNGTVDYDGFDFQMPKNYTADDYGTCDWETGIKWSEATSFTYSLNFTNTSSAALFTVITDKSHVTLSFTGSRVDEGIDVEPENNGNSTAIALADPRQNSMPHFTFANGTELKFKGRNGSTWSASSKGTSQTRPWDSMTLWCALIGVLAMSSLGL